MRYAFSQQVREPQMLLAGGSAFQLCAGGLFLQFNLNLCL